MPERLHPATPKTAAATISALFVVTAGAGIRDARKKPSSAANIFMAHALQALAIETAEGCAEWLHRRIREDWGFPDPPTMTMQERFTSRYRGKRYSFGYPACPNLDDQQGMWKLLRPEDIGVRADRRHDDGAGSQRQRAGLPSPRLRVLHGRRRPGSCPAARSRQLTPGVPAPVEDIGQFPGVLIKLDLQLLIFVDNQLRSGIKDACTLALVSSVQIELAAGQVELRRMESAQTSPNRRGRFVMKRIFLPVGSESP